MSLDDATLRQIEAADPSANTWLSANAGSGKTRVLTDRVARLLLADVSPQNILCLTYTKAAASEMQNRLFERLGAWAMKPDAELRQELRNLGVEDVADLSRARRLFAGAIETPGGLKIQTIHSFCAAILRRFPLEAGVTPQFREMDDRTAKLLQAEVLDDMASGAERQRLEALAAFFTDTEFSRLTRDIVSKRDAFADAVTADQVWGWFGLPPGFDAAALEADTFAVGDGALLAGLVPILADGSPTDAKAAEKLSGLDPAVLALRDLPILESVLLTGKSAKEPFSAKTGSFPTKATREGPAAPLMPALDDLMSRVEAARPLRLALDAAGKTFTLHAFARPFIEEYEARKHAHGWLDFDDLITLAGRLLNDPGLAAWVLYRLDGGIDHILVDEAQDTSPAQWRVIESLAREFTAGESARSDRERTLFVVGDLKQSIYSFQGADPAEFTRMHSQFDAAFKEVGRGVAELQLEYSFRSSRAVLDLVDHSLKDAPGLGSLVKHIAFDNSRPGRVDLWPLVEAPEKPEKSAWTDPVDVAAPEDAPVILANAVADAVAEILKTGSIPAKNGGMRAVRPGDVMVLVRRRSELFHQIIRACKTRGLAVAGADRLRIEAELAVRDITATLAFLATPEDDLSLAAALRSPLFGLTEDELFRLAHGRGKGSYLWNALRAGAAHPDAIGALTDLRDEADFLRPYDLIDRILTRHDGRRRLIARLGPEAEDGIDALLAQALAYERMEVPSLTGFLTWLAAEDVEIKRQMDNAGDQIRVMTVHGAKGLESPLVILPDTSKPRNNSDGKLIDIGGQMAWRMAQDHAPAAIAAALAAAKERDWEEHMRLLYVAMTRAESWLIVAGAGDVGKAGEAVSWYRIAEAGMQVAGAVAHNFPTGEGLRFERGEWHGEVGPDAARARSSASLPDWASAHPGLPETPAAALTPSDLGGAKIVGGGDDDEADPEAALRRGRQIHRLLEFLPGYDRGEWPQIAEDLLAFGEDAAGPEEVADLLAEARGVLDAPGLAPLFTADALAEVEISAPVSVAGARRLHGVIDRLVIGPDRVLAVDFKTNRIAPDRAEDTPEGILRQMGAYETALAGVFPGKRIETAVLWTRVAKLMPLPPGLALRAFGRLDGTGDPT
ncbi:double-strand break repair helicase AddA [Sinisalibacter aestuarii]|uniref:DNA 3'-5' helicase n=1 Tax=Sinisalibacter aestuarii TaxID=2949426 RepID=A0ABQ5LQY5_9RHOB|nr:double-strand break repair helicase AddA [Sinisalibacter aestuarii]GKY86482.1 double-strand break repair helicase AddA [Sinisalibacter aestuarii]